MNSALANWARARADAIRTSLWALPALMFLVGVGLAVLALSLGTVWPSADGVWGQLLSSGNGEDARNLLSTLLAAVIGMASIVFSITVVSLSLAANAYGPRLIRTFRSSRSTQLVIGVFMMTIIYLLIVLRTVRGQAEAAETPDAAIAIATLLSVVAVLALLAFIQGVATLVVADEVVRRVRREFDSAIAELPLIESTPEPASPPLPADFDERAGRIRLPREGYVQAVQYSELVEWAEQRDAIVRLDFRPGDFVVEGDHKVLVYPAPADPEQARREIDRCIVSGQQRTPTQDLEFAVRHLVEVAVRALSPGINDSYTAMAVIDRLRGGLARLCARRLPPRALLGKDGKLRVSRDSTSFPGAVNAALNQIRQSGAAMPSIVVHMLQAIGSIAEHVRTDEQRDSFAHHARLIRSAAERNIREQSDLEDVERAFRNAMDALGSRAAEPERKPRTDR